MLAALSLVLNGGGVAQLKTINVELTKAMEGHEDDIQGALRQLDTFIGGLDEHKAEIVRALDGLDRLSARLAAQKDDIALAIEDLGPGLKVLADQREQLTAMLTALSDLGRVGTRVINASKDDTVANLRALHPILTRSPRPATNLPNALEMLLTYPFPQAATGGVQRRLHQPAHHRRPRPADDPRPTSTAARTPACRPAHGPDLAADAVGAAPRPLPTLPVPTVPALPTCCRPAPTLTAPGGGGRGLVCVPAWSAQQHAEPLDAGCLRPDLARLMMGGYG